MKNLYRIKILFLLCFAVSVLAANVGAGQAAELTPEKTEIPAADMLRNQTPFISDDLFKGFKEVKADKAELSQREILEKLFEELGMVEESLNDDVLQLTEIREKDSINKKEWEKFETVNAEAMKKQEKIIDLLENLQIVEKDPEKLKIVEAYKENALKHAKVVLIMFKAKAMYKSEDELSKKEAADYEDLQLTYQFATFEAARAMYNLIEAYDLN